MRFLVAVLVSLALVVGILRAVPMDEVWRAVRCIDPILALGAMVFALANLWLRGGRWSLLFSHRRRVSSSAAAELAVLGIALNAVLPGRVGELVRIGLGSKRFGTGVAFTTATVVAERLLDGLTLLALLGLSLAAIPSLSALGPVEILGYGIGGEMVEGVVITIAMGCLAIAAVVAMLSLPVVQHNVLAGLVRRQDRAGWRWLRPVTGTLGSAREGFGALRSPTILLRLGMHSTAIWLALVLCNWTVALAVDGLSLSFWQAAVVTVVAVAAAALPSVPGGWGVFEAGGLLALEAVGVEATWAVSVTYVFAAHLAQYLPGVASGLVIAVRQGLQPTELLDAAPAAGPPHRRGDSGDDGPLG